MSYDRYHESEKRDSCARKSGSSGHIEGVNLSERHLSGSDINLSPCSDALAYVLVRRWIWEVATTGIAFHYVSSLYIALLSHFIPCSAWEGIYLIDAYLHNQSLIQPTTLHTDIMCQ